MRLAPVIRLAKQRMCAWDGCVQPNTSRGTALIAISSLPLTELFVTSDERWHYNSDNGSEVDVGRRRTGPEMSRQPLTGRDPCHGLGPARQQRNWAAPASAHDAPWTWRIFAPAIRGSPACGSPSCSGFAAVEWMDIWSSGARMDPGSLITQSQQPWECPQHRRPVLALLFGPPGDPSPSKARRQRRICSCPADLASRSLPSEVPSTASWEALLFIIYLPLLPRVMLEDIISYKRVWQFHHRSHAPAYLYLSVPRNTYPHNPSPRVHLVYLTATLPTDSLDTFYPTCLTPISQISTLRANVAASAIAEPQFATTPREPLSELSPDSLEVLHQQPSTISSSSLFFNRTRPRPLTFLPRDRRSRPASKADRRRYLSTHNTFLQSQTHQKA